MKVTILEDKEAKRTTLKLFLFIVLTIPIIFIMFTLYDDLETGENKCAMSEYNTYSNSTKGYSKFFYKTKEVCRGGILGIGMSCYESEEERTKLYCTTKVICFNIKNGEKCKNFIN